MKILMISGTFNASSKTHALLKEAEAVCRSYGIDCQIEELCDYAITAGQTSARRGLDVLIADIQSAEAIIFATPNYQGSMSGLMKVAIDAIPEHGLKDKAVGLIAVSGGMGRMSQPISHLRDVVAALDGLAVSTAIACYGADFEASADGTSVLQTPKLKLRVKEMVEELYSYAELVKVAQERWA